MIKENNQIGIAYLALGVLLWWVIGGFSVLLEVIIKDLLLNLNIQPLIVAWSKATIDVLTMIFGFILGLRIIESSKKPKIILFRNLVLLFILGQILQITFPILTDLLRTDNYSENLMNYFDLFTNKPTMSLIINFFRYLGYLGVAIIAYRKIKNIG